MQRIFLSLEEFDNKKFNHANYHHIANVLRQKNGQIEVSYQNKVYLANIFLKDETLYFQIEKELSYQAKDYQVTIIQGSAKGDKNDDIIKYLTELDLNSLIFVDMQRSISKISDKKDKKLARYQTIMENSANQAHRASLVEIDIKKDLKDLSYSEYDVKLLLDEEEAKKEKPLYLNKEILDGKKIALVVGPEGGIDDKERKFLLDNGFISVAITNTILRCEMAAMVSLAMIEVLKR